MRRLAGTVILISAVYVSGCDVPSQDSATAPDTTTCNPDIAKLCADVEPGGGRIQECLTKQKDKVSEACKQAAKLKSP